MSLGLKIPAQGLLGKFTSGKLVYYNFMFGSLSLDVNAAAKKLTNWPPPLPCHLLGVSTEQNSSGRRPSRRYGQPFPAVVWSGGSLVQ